MENSYAIRVKDVRKSFKIYFDKGNTIKEKMINHQRNRYEERRVLDGISFNIRKGEAIGLIGGNGCGKSTTLKLLTKIIFPDEGIIEINGRVSSLLELGAGFHPDMSGRENIYTNAAIFGLKRKEIDQRLNDIIQFSELDEFIDNPVRTYSSGMYMRLAFSVAINVDADVLLIDEILAVGDISFQKKCMNKINEIKKMGTTIVLVSHSIGQIEDICDRTIWLENGKVREEGESKDVTFHYQELMEERRLEKIRLLGKKNATKNNQEDVSAIFHKLTIRNGNGKARFSKVWLEDEFGKKQEIFGEGNNFKIRSIYECSTSGMPIIMSIAITRQDGILCFATNSSIKQEKELQLLQRGDLTIAIENCNLLNGIYMLNVALTSLEGEVYDDLQRVLFFKIDSTTAEEGICRLNCRWI